MALWIVVVIFALYISQFAYILLRENRRQETAAAWILIAMTCPFLGFAAYLVAEHEFPRRRRLRAEELTRLRLAREISANANTAADVSDQLEDKLFHMLSAVSQRSITGRNRVTVLTNGEAKFTALLRELALAERHIHLDYYTIRDDGIGTQLADILVERARAGVEVRVLYDGLGSWRLGDAYIGRLREAGVLTCCFSPPRSAILARRLNYRNHSKIAVIDGKIGFVGGINIGDEYLGKNPKLGFWRDTQLKLEGDAVYFLQELFMKHWAYARGESLPFPSYAPPHQCRGEERVLIVASGPDGRKLPILETACAAIAAAKDRVYMTTPYFIPDRSLLTALRCAALDGTDVRLIIPGVADTQLVLWATLSYVQPLLDAGVRVYRYRRGFIHAKVLIIDELLATVGTANMDLRSFYSNFEQNAVLFDRATIARLERDFAQDMRDSEELDPAAFRARPRREKIRESFAHLLSPLL